MNSHTRRYSTMLAIVLALPAQAQIAKTATQAAPPKPAAAGTQPRIESALENVRQRLLAGEVDKAAYDELVSAIQSSFDSLQQGTPDALPALRVCGRATRAAR